MVIPMFGFVLLSFLLLGVVLAVAVFFAFRSGDAGTTKLSGVAGCLIALALLAIAGAGAVGLAIVAIVRLPAEAVRHGPVESIDLEWQEDAPETPPDPTAPDGTEHPGSGSGAAPSARRPGQGTLRVTVELRGLEDPSDVMHWLRRNTDSETGIALRESRDDKGNAVTVVELTLPPRHDLARELRQMRRDLERDAPDLRLPSGVKIKFRGPDE